MDELWKYFTTNFEDKILKNLPIHTAIVNKLKTILLDGGIYEIQNILLYGAKGFPMNLIWESVFRELFGTNYYKNLVVWHNKVNYIETPYFFEIDMDDPNNTKELDALSMFVKEIIQHKCVHSTRHVIIINNIERLCTRRSSYSFRVLLERYSANAIFICTTNHFGSIESPLTSRCINIRIPLLTSQEITTIMTSLEFTHHPLLKANGCRDIYFTLYVHWLTCNMPEIITEEFCNYNTPGLLDLLKNKKKNTIEDIRTYVSKISVHDPSMRELTIDILNTITNNKKKHEFISKATEIEHMIATTEGQRKPLYIELLLNYSLFGL
jgi:hypothetical protein